MTVSSPQTQFLSGIHRVWIDLRGSIYGVQQGTEPATPERTPSSCTHSTGVKTKARDGPSNPPKATKLANGDASTRTQMGKRPAPQLEGVERRARGGERNQGLGSDPPLIRWPTRAASQTGPVPYRLMLIVTNGEDRQRLFR